ncbi:MAG: hypothetical protein JOZ90_05890 [Alphaproteobacteria bacterium]|nr:hypothetical protein [Alphaproteobacteria bacterium]MBV9373225.1 hypothetical protein [Alphaproteobacteria bacterium]MBV9900613.1 hypothetical protein [Alphaproteobacteria bacterium]
MGDERVLAAVGRIERALARLEAAADRSPAPGPADGELRRAHETLKGKVEQAIARIDRLLASADSD